MGWRAGRVRWSRRGSRFTGHNCDRLRAAVVAAVKIGLERAREVHGLARRGPVKTPVSRQAGDQHQAPSGFRVGWRIHRHWHGPRRVVDINAYLATGAGDDKQDSLARLVSYGIG